MVVMVEGGVEWVKMVFVYGSFCVVGFGYNFVMVV